MIFKTILKCYVNENCFWINNKQYERFLFLSSDMDKTICDRIFLVEMICININRIWKPIVLFSNPTMYVLSIMFFRDQSYWGNVGLDNHVIRKYLLNDYIYYVCLLLYSKRLYILLYVNVMKLTRLRINWDKSIWTSRWIYLHTLVIRHTCVHKNSFFQM